MKRSAALVFTATLVLGTGLMTTHVSASADEQAVAEAAIAAFNERMTEAGGVSDGPVDITEVDPADAEEGDDFGMECFGAAAVGLDAGGRMEGETARSFSEEFTFASPEAPATTDPTEMFGLDEDNVSAAIVSVDADHEAAIEELVDQMGSGEAAQCLEDAFFAAASATEGAGPAESSGEPQFEVETSAESDLGIGDASAALRIRIASEADEFSYEYQTTIFVARVDRTLVYVIVIAGAEPMSDIDGEAELAALVDAL